MFSDCVLFSLELVLVLVIMKLVFFEMLLEILVFSVFRCFLVVLWVSWVRVLVSIMVCLFSGLVMILVSVGVLVRICCIVFLVVSSIVLWLLVLSQLVRLCVVLFGRLVLMNCLYLVLSIVCVLGNVVISFFVCRWVMLGIFDLINSCVRFSFLCSLVLGVCILLMWIWLICSRLLMVCWLFCCLKKWLSDCVILLLMFGMCLNKGYGRWWISFRLLNYCVSVLVVFLFMCLMFSVNSSCFSVVV